MCTRRLVTVICLVTGFSAACGAAPRAAGSMSIASVVPTIELGHASFRAGVPRYMVCRSNRTHVRGCWARFITRQPGGTSNECPRYVTVLIRCWVTAATAARAGKYG